MLYTSAGLRVCACVCEAFVYPNLFIVAVACLSAGHFVMDKSVSWNICMTICSSSLHWSGIWSTVSSFEVESSKQPTLPVFSWKEISREACHVSKVLVRSYWKKYKIHREPPGKRQCCCVDTCFFLEDYCVWSQYCTFASLFQKLHAITRLSHISFVIFMGCL